MSKVTTGASMSIDGYIAGPNETGFEHLFAWYGNGDVEIPTADPELTMRVTRASADHLSNVNGSLGVLICGRHLYDMMNAWGGRHPLDLTTVVLTHERPADRPEDDENFVFVTDGIEAAVAKARGIAGEKNVGVNGGTIARQCLEAGLLDEIGVDLVPVLLGGGTPFFSELAKIPVVLEGPVSIVEGKDVTHLLYRVRH